MDLQVLVSKPGHYRITDYAIYWTFPDGLLNTVQAGPPILLHVEQIQIASS